MRLHDLAPIIQWNFRGLKFNLIDLITGPSSSPSCFFFYLQETHLKKLYNNSENWLCVQHLCRWGWTSCSGFFHNLQRLFAFIVLRTIDYDVKLIQFLDFEERRRGFGIFIFFFFVCCTSQWPAIFGFLFSPYYMWQTIVIPTGTNILVEKRNCITTKSIKDQYQNKIYQLCTVYCRIMHFSPNHQTNNI